MNGLRFGEIAWGEKNGQTNQIIFIPIPLCHEKLINCWIIWAGKRGIRNGPTWVIMPLIYKKLLFIFALESFRGVVICEVVSICSVFRSVDCIMLLCFGCADTDLPSVCWICPLYGVFRYIVIYTGFQIRFVPGIRVRWALALSLESSFRIKMSETVSAIYFCFETTKEGITLVCIYLFM